MLIVPTFTGRAIVYMLVCVCENEIVNYVCFIFYTCVLSRSTNYGLNFTNINSLVNNAVLYQTFFSRDDVVRRVSPFLF